MSNTKDENLYTKDDLNNLGIYDLREIGRSVGVPSPTTMKKEQLIDYILKIIYGEDIKTSKGKLSGRPARKAQKSNNIFIDLIEKVEAPKCNKTFIEKDDHKSTSFAYGGLISSKVASSGSSYINSAEYKEDNLCLKTGTVCYEEDKIVVRKYRFVASITDPFIPKKLVEDYALRDNDIIEYLLDNEGASVAQIIKKNGEIASRIEIQKNPNILREQSEQLEIKNGVYIATNSSNIVYAPTQLEREDLIERMAKVFRNLDYAVVKVCFDRTSANANLSSSSKLAEIFAESIGDEYETMAMAETAVEKAQFYNLIGFKSVLLIDNLAWLLSVIKTYPEEVYGNFIQKLARITKGVGNNITLVCVSSHINNETVQELSNYFDNIMVN